MKPKRIKIGMRDIIQMLAKVHLKEFTGYDRDDVRTEIRSMLISARKITEWIEENHPEAIVSVEVAK